MGLQTTGKVINVLYMANSVIILLIALFVVDVMFNNISYFLKDDSYWAMRFFGLAAACNLYLSVLGFTANKKERISLLHMNALSNGVIIVFNVIVIYSVWIKAKPMSNEIDENMHKSMFDYYDSQSAHNGWDFIQKKFKCCGINSPKDWENVTIPNSIIPKSCCLDPLCILVYADGCEPIVKHQLAGVFTLILLQFFVIILLNVSSMIVSVLLIKQIKRKLNAGFVFEQFNNNIAGNQNMYIIPTKQ